MMKGNTEEGIKAGYEFPEIEKDFYHIHVQNKQNNVQLQKYEVSHDAVLKDTIKQFNAKQKRNAYDFALVELYHDPTKVQEEKPKKGKKEEN